ncbi:hypothetical protein AX769_05760 [Frondihabitans sp. PAMC 28766]|nr:hypothetical protein AX769_05760 [Frondihabitans sp. PAMC 28766]
MLVTPAGNTSPAVGVRITGVLMVVAVIGVGSGVGVGVLAGSSFPEAEEELEGFVEELGSGCSEVTLGDV